MADATWHLGATGLLLLNPDGDIAMPCSTGLWAPVRKCSDGGILYTNPPTNTIPYKLGCTTVGDGINYFWSNDIQACLYVDCSEAISGALEDGWVLGPGGGATLDPNCTDPICDYDNDGNPDPPGPGPTETYDATGCGCDADFAMSVTASVSVTICTCADNFGFQNYSGVNQTLRLRSAGGCTFTGIARCTFTEYGTHCGDPTDFEARIIVTATLSGGQWTATVVGQFYSPGLGIWSGTSANSMFVCTTPTGDCTGGSLTNENASCPNGAQGGTLTITAAVLP